jgi:hypothetical protein
MFGFQTVEPRQHVSGAVFPALTGVKVNGLGVYAPDCLIIRNYILNFISHNYDALSRIQNEFVRCCATYLRASWNLTCKLNGLVCMLIDCGRTKAAFEELNRVRNGISWNRNLGFLNDIDLWIALKAIWNIWN